MRLWTLELMQEWGKTFGAVGVENIHFADKKDMILGASMLDSMFTFS